MQLVGLHVMHVPAHAKGRVGHGAPLQLQRPLMHQAGNGGALLEAVSHMERLVVRQMLGEGMEEDAHASGV